MLKDIKEMIDYVKELSCLICEKEVFFYDFDTDAWYSREHCRNVEFSEIIEWLRETVNPCFYNDERDCTYIVKYRNEGTDENWNYKEFNDEESCFPFVIGLKVSGGMECKVFKEDLDF